MRILLLIIVAIGVAIGALMPAAPLSTAPAAAPVTPKDERRRETVIERAGNSHFYAEAEVNGKPVEFVVDTGATSVVLSLDDASRLGIPFDRQRFDVVGQGASGPVRGEMLTLGSVVLDGKRVYDVEGAVVEGLDRSLLGQSYLKHISIEVRGDAMRLY